MLQVDDDSPALRIQDGDTLLFRWVEAASADGLLSPNSGCATCSCIGEDIEVIGRVLRVVRRVGGRESSPRPVERSVDPARFQRVGGASGCDIPLSY